MHSRSVGRGRSTPARAARVLTGFLAAAGLVGLAGCTSIKVRLAMNEGVSYYKAREYEKAVESFRKAIVIDPRYADAHLDLGLTYMELYEPGSEHPKDLEYAEGAIEAFKKYIELNPENQKAREYLINMCNLSHRMPDAIDFFMKDYEKNPRNLELVKMIAALYRMAGDMEKNIEWYEKAAELEPGNPETYYSVGVACWGRSYNTMTLDYDSRMALIDKGLQMLEKALELKKDYYEAYSYVNLLYREKAKYDISPAQAVAWRQKADEAQARALELRNQQLAAAAAQAARAAGDAAPAGSVPRPAGPGGD